MNRPSSIDTSVIVACPCCPAHYIDPAADLADHGNDNDGARVGSPRCPLTGSARDVEFHARSLHNWWPSERETAIRAMHSNWRPFADVLAECDGWLNVTDTDIDTSIELSCIREMNTKGAPPDPVRLNPTDGVPRCWPYIFHGFVSRRERPRSWRAFAVCRHGYAQEF